jgi:hypothetical protein
MGQEQARSGAGAAREHMHRGASKFKGTSKKRFRLILSPATQERSRATPQRSIRSSKTPLPSPFTWKAPSFKVPYHPKYLFCDRLTAPFGS